MSSIDQPGAALGRRVAEACEATDTERSGDVLLDLARLLGRWGEGEPGGLAWFATASVLGRLPDEQEVRALGRVLDLDGPEAGVAALLAQGLHRPGDGLLRDVEVVAGGTLVLARPDANDELTLMLRGVLPHWRQHGCVVAALSEDGDLLSRVPAAAEPLLLPWRATVVLVGGGWSRAQGMRLATLAQLSGSRVVVLPPDQLPIAAPELTTPERTTEYGNLLPIVKHAAGAVTFTTVAAKGYRGYAQALGAQGLPGPKVSLVRGAHGLELPVVRPTPDDPAGGAPVKIAVLPDGPEGAATELARALQYRVPAAEVVALGPERLLRLATPDRDTDLGPPEARVVVALGPGGHGLLLAGALGQGVPAVVSDFGVPSEVAADGGCQQVDADDDGAVLEAVVSLITDSVRHRNLAADAGRRQRTSWEAFATELWRAVAAAGAAET